MDNVTGYIIGGVIALLVLFTLAPTLIEQYDEIEFGDAPSGVEATVGAVLVIFFVLILYTMYKEAE